MLTTIVVSMLAIMLTVIVARVMIVAQAVSLQAQPTHRYTILFSDPTTEGATWCVYDSLDAATEAIAALNATYDGSKRFWLQQPRAVISSGGDRTINGQLIRLAPPKPVETPKPVKQEGRPVWLQRLIDDEQRRRNPNPYNRPWSEGYRQRGWPYDD